MYLWNTEQLARELKENTLEEKEKLKYLLAWIIPQIAFTYDFIFTEPVIAESKDYIEFGIALFLTVIGTISCYQINQEGDKVHFIDRYISLGLPISIRLIVIFIPVYLISMAIATAVFDDVESWLDLEMVFLMYCFYYWRLWIWTKAISHNELPETP